MILRKRVIKLYRRIKKGGTSLDKEIQEYIEHTTKEYIEYTTKEVVSELKRQGMMKDNKRTPFQKTEMVLYNYNDFNQAIKVKYLQIETIQAEGIQKKSSSIKTLSTQTMYYEMKSDSDRADEKIQSIEQSIQTTKNYIKVIDTALDSLRDDAYFDIIPMKYFESCTREEIAEYFDVDASTISRNKNRLIKILQNKLFSDEVIYEIFC